MERNEVTKLQCGYEDTCEEDSCLHCPRKHTITIEVTEAELSCVENCGVADLQWYKEEKPEQFEVLQSVMMHLSMKMFKEIE